MKRAKTSRRDFLAFSGSLALGGFAFANGGRRRRCPCPPDCQPVCQPACVSAGSAAWGQNASPAGASAAGSNRVRALDATLAVRINIEQFTVQQLDSLRRGVAKMKSLPASDMRSWHFQANIHGTTGPVTSPLFNQCEHGTLLFFPWHRGYLYYFERILQWAAEDPSLTLPYWDWTNFPSLPQPYLTPANSSNPLYQTGRDMYDGSALPSEVVVDDLRNALNLTDFPAAGDNGFSPSLEGSPHGAVHGLVGGVMRRVPTAANDPIFWLHHANIDRLWDQWLLSLDNGRANPTSTAWLDQSYSFVDSDGQVVTRMVRDIVSSAGLGYRYDSLNSVPIGVGPMMATAPQPALVAAQPAGVRAATSHPDGPQADEKKPLGFKPEAMKLPIAAEHRAMLAQAEVAPAKPKRFHLQIEGLSISDTPAFTYAVYVNLPEGATKSEEMRPFYAGSINFFGKVAGAAQGHGHGKVAAEFTESIDITALVGRLKQANKWKADELNVSLKPLTSVAPAGGEAAVKQRAEASAEKAKIRYRRVNLVVVP